MPAWYSFSAAAIVCSLPTRIRDMRFCNKNRKKRKRKKRKKKKKKRKKRKKKTTQSSHDDSVHKCENEGVGFPNYVNYISVKIHVLY